MFNGIVLISCGLTLVRGVAPLFFENGSCMILHVLLVVHLWKIAGEKQIAFYFSWRNFVGLFLIFLLHHLKLLMFLLYALSIIPNFKYLSIAVFRSIGKAVIDSLLWYSDNRFAHAILNFSIPFHLLYFLFQALLSCAPSTSIAACWIFSFCCFTLLPIKQGSVSLSFPWRAFESRLGQGQFQPRKKSWRDWTSRLHGGSLHWSNLSSWKWEHGPL